jgi:hypothetical protein
MWLESRLANRQPECLVVIERAARLGLGGVLISLDVEKGEVEVKAKVRSDSLNDVPTG